MTRRLMVLALLLVSAAGRVPAETAAPVITGYRTTAGAEIGSAAAGSRVLIVGAHLEGSRSVSFSGIPTIALAKSPTSITVTVPAASTYPHVGPVIVTAGDGVVKGPEFTITAPPQPPSVRNVSDFGAKGDGTTDDRAAIQKALDAAKPGESIYFPAGTYRIIGTLRVHENDVRLHGDGEASTIRGDTTAHHLIAVHDAARPLAGIRFEGLRFLGARVFNRATNQGHGIGLNGVKDTLISGCRFEGCGTSIADGNGTSGTTVVNCQFRDWGSEGFLAGGGASVRDCSFVQSDPNSADRVTSHAIHLRPVSSNCVIESCSFSGVRFFAIQISGLDLGSSNGSVRIERNTFTGNAQDVYVAAGTTGSQITITDNSFSQTRGVSVQIKQGDQIRVSRNQFKGLSSGAVWVGDWSVFEEGGVLSHVTVDDNRYTQSGGRTLQYVFFVSGARGSLSDVTLQGNSVDAFREPPPFQSAAIYLEEAQGALVAKNHLTMAPGAGTANVCAGVRIVSGNSVLVQENVVNGTGTLYAYGVYGTGLSNPGNKITNNTLNHCQLQAGGAAESNNQIVYP